MPYKPGPDDVPLQTYHAETPDIPPPSDGQLESIHDGSGDGFADTPMNDSLGSSEGGNDNEGGNGDEEEEDEENEEGEEEDGAEHAHHCIKELKASLRTERRFRGFLERFRVVSEENVLLRMENELLRRQVGANNASGNRI